MVRQPKRNHQVNATPKLIEALQYAAAGWSQKQTAKELGVSTIAVRVRLKRASELVNAPNVISAVFRYVEEGKLDLAEIHRLRYDR